MKFEISLEHISGSSSQETINQLSEMASLTFADTFRHYTKDDLESYLRDSLSAEVLRAEILDANNHFYFFNLNGQRVGFVKWIFPGSKYLESFQTDKSPLLLLERFYFLPEYCGFGLGTAALAMVEVFARYQVEASALYLSVWEKNLRAQHFYKKHGFRQVGCFEYPVGEALDLEFLYLKDLRARRA